MVRATGSGLLLIAGLTATGCGPPALPSRGDPPRILLEPEAPLDAAPAVLRIHVSGLPGVDPNALLLFRGALESYHSARIRSAALPATLEERRVPSIAYAREDGR